MQINLVIIKESAIMGREQLQIWLDVSRVHLAESKLELLEPGMGLLLQLRFGSLIRLDYLQVEIELRFNLSEEFSQYVISHCLLLNLQRVILIFSFPPVELEELLIDDISQAKVAVNLLGNEQAI